MTDNWAQLVRAIENECLAHGLNPRYALTTDDTELTASLPMANGKRFTWVFTATEIASVVPASLAADFYSWYRQQS